MTVTTGSVLSPKDQEIEYNNCRDAGTVLKIITGDRVGPENKPTDGIMLVDTKEILMLTIQNYVDEKVAAQRHGIIRPSGPIPPQLHKR